jgi:hypothetical protein
MEETRSKDKRKVTVVKNLRDLSPKKQLYITKKPDGTAPLNDFEESLKGNSSPQVDL